jgi:hypothetical protein
VGFGCHPAERQPQAISAKAARVTSADFLPGVAGVFVGNAEFGVLVPWRDYQAHARTRGSTSHGIADQARQKPTQQSNVCLEDVRKDQGV